jgi:hypothetical protein
VVFLIDILASGSRVLICNIIILVFFQSYTLHFHQHYFPETWIQFFGIPFPTKYSVTALPCLPCTKTSTPGLPVIGDTGKSGFLLVIHLQNTHAKEGWREGKEKEKEKEKKTRTRSSTRTHLPQLLRHLFSLHDQERLEPHYKRARFPALPHFDGYLNGL